MLPLFVAAHAVVAGRAAWSPAACSRAGSCCSRRLIEALLWPVATWLLLAPQRRAPDPDENRPL